MHNWHLNVACPWPCPPSLILSFFHSLFIMLFYYFLFDLLSTSFKMSLFFVFKKIVISLPNFSSILLPFFCFKFLFIIKDICLREREMREEGEGEKREGWKVHFLAYGSWGSVLSWQAWAVSILTWWAIPLVCWWLICADDFCLRCWFSHPCCWLFLNYAAELSFAFHSSTCLTFLLSHGQWVCLEKEQPMH